MRHRSRSRNYDSSDNYKSRRSPAKYESSRTHKSKIAIPHYSSESHKHSSRKPKKSSDRSHYEMRRERDSDSDDKYEKKVDSSYDRDCKRAKYSKYSRNDSPIVVKSSRKYDDYTHSYRRKSISSDVSNHSYNCKYKKYDDKIDSKKSYYKSNKESKRVKPSRSISSDQISEIKIKEKVKDKKLKKKSKKTSKDKEKKKRKRQKHSSEEEIKENSSKKQHSDEKKQIVVDKSTKNSTETESKKDKLKLEPFKVKESSNLKSQITFLNSSSIFTKDEWQKESSDDDVLHKKPDKDSQQQQQPEIKKIKLELSIEHDAKPIVKSDINEEICKDIPMKNPKSDDGKDQERERVKRKSHRSSQSKVHESNSKSSKNANVDEEKVIVKSKSGNSHRKERSYSCNTTGEIGKVPEQKEKLKSKDNNASSSSSNNNNSKTAGKSTDDKRKVEDSFEDERIELPRTPTDAQYTGLFARLHEEPVSDTEIEAILPPILLDDRMKALLVNDPNVTQEAWDSEDDVLLNKRDTLIAPKHRGVLEILSVPWKTLIEEASLNKIKQDQNNNKGLRKFDVSNLLNNIGISKQLSGETLWNCVQSRCPNALLHPIAPIHQTLISQKMRRNSIFCERGMFAGALSARKDLLIRRVLCESIA